MHALHGNAGAERGDDLVSWRLQYLAWAGLDPALAAVVATDLRWDLHALLELLELGCPAPLAARILAPLDDVEVPHG